MCLIACAWRYHANYPLVVAANRDEFYRRPTEAADRWQQAPHVVAGRDKEQGGTWLGVSERGRFAAVTNARGVAGARDAPSRGLLVSDFLLGEQTAEDFARSRLADIHRYAGCNLLLADQDRLLYLTNHPEPELRELKPGLHALSNGHIDHQWPKMRRVNEGLAASLGDRPPEPETLFAMMTDREPASADLPDTGIGRVLEKQLSPVFIRLPTYGTRCTTVLTVGSNGSARFMERRYNNRGEVDGQSDIDLQLSEVPGSGLDSTLEKADT